MKKTFYTTPTVTVRTVSFSSAILAGSEYGQAGKAGKGLDELDELEF